MRKTAVIFVLAALPFAAGLLWGKPAGSRQAPPVPQATQTQTQTAGDRSKPRKVDFRADYIRPINFADSTALNLVGNVVFYHNGAVITCDSAIRFSEKWMECYGRVLINQKTTYIYGDKADYNGETNVANVYAPLVKVVDKDAVMYTRNFSFNTLDNIGRYWGGATLSQNANLMESDRGYYYLDTKDMIGVQRVEMRDSVYMLKSDSVIYNLDSEIAHFFTRTYIWNDKGEILSADKGWYNHLTSTYFFTKEAYVMTADQEIWADTMDYNEGVKHALFFSNVQMRDEGHKSMGFGDFAEYWGDRDEGLLTRNPSVLNWEEGGDTLYMRSDSIFLFTVNAAEAQKLAGQMAPAATTSTEELLTSEIAEISPSRPPHRDSIAPGQPVPGPLGIIGTGTELTDVQVPSPAPAAYTNPWLGTAASPPAGTAPVTDSTALLSIQGGPVPLTPEQQLEYQRRLATAAALEKKDEQAQAAALAAEQAKAAELAKAGGLPKTKKQLAAERKQARREAKEIKRKAKDEARRAKLRARMARRSRIALPDSLAAKADSLKLPVDSAALAPSADSLAAKADSLALIPPDSVAAIHPDSVQRVIKGYYNVRMYRSDFQAVCDSVMAFTIDSTVHMFVEPVMWNEDNQITSEKVTIYSKSQQIEKAVYSGGGPMMISQVDSMLYNQVKGKTIEAYFRDNDIYRTDVIGNAQTYYYMQDDQAHALTGFLVAECADITFMIENKQMDKIIYRGQPVYTIYPMEKIPSSQEQQLPGFTWQAPRRPGLADVFTRTVRSSQREMYETMPQPHFPLTGMINNSRKALVVGGGWHDREDVLSTLAQDFVRSLEHR